MKGKKIASVVAVSAAALAMSLNPQAGTVKNSNEISTSKEQKQSRQDANSKAQSVMKVTRHNVNGSGLDIVRLGGDYGMSPKEYGIRFGHGNRVSKTNFLRLSRQKKIAKRMA